MNKTSISLTLNGQQVGPIEVVPETSMLDFLHEYLNLTGTKFGCGAGICHACVIVEKTPTELKTHRTCISGIGKFNGKELYTVEGHATTDPKTGEIALHPVQQAFIEGYAFQCGWCTSGFVNEAVVFYENLKKQPVAKTNLRAAMEQALGEHICRCTGYVKYYEALEKAVLNAPETLVH